MTECCSAAAYPASMDGNPLRTPSPLCIVCRRGTVKVRVSIGEGPGVGKAWGSGTCGGGRS